MQKIDQDYVTTHLRPLEREKLVCEIDLCQEQVRLTMAQAKDQEYITSHIRPKEELIKQEELQLAKTKNDIAIKDLAIRDKELLLKGKEIDLADKRLDQLQADISVKNAQVRLHDRQIQGFNENKWQKLFEATMNGWGLAFSSGMLEYSPSIVNDESLTGLFNKLNQG
jgi:uncharacterized protein (DUF3084 family)